MSFLTFEYAVLYAILVILIEKKEHIKLNFSFENFEIKAQSLTQYEFLPLLQCVTAQYKKKLQSF